MGQPEPLHPANAEAIAEFAEETGAEVLRGDLRYPSYSGGWQLGDIDFSEHLAKYRDHKVVIVIASIGKADEVVAGRAGGAGLRGGAERLRGWWRGAVGE